MSDSCRWVVEPKPQSGAWNMAMDAALLESALKGGRCAARFYRWERPTVSLGYFQKPEEAAADPLLAGLPVVRRLSGGGAILHDQEWTYSLAVPPGHPAGREPIRLYERAHLVIIDWLNARGAPARLRGGTEFNESESAAPVGVAKRPAEAFLCFGRGDPRDIVLNGFKIVGSAQRRRRGGILQHGSVLMRASPYAAQFPGLMDLAPNVDWFAELPAAIAGAMAGILGTPVEAKEWSEPELEIARRSLFEF